MRKSPFMLAFAITFIVALLISNAGCGKKKVVPVQPPPPKVEPVAPPEPPKPPAPKVSLKVTPGAIEKGQSATLSWESENAANVVIDNGIGTVEASGSRTIQPSVSTTYLAKVSNVSGNAAAEIRITVTVPAPVIPPPTPPVITDAAFFGASIKDVFFDFDQSTVRDDARQILAANARALAERPGIRISIEGYCDERGSEKYNLVLGDKRANAIKDYLITLGVNASRIDTISYGEEKNFCEDHTEECWQLNRRAHFVLR
jgi:peptidoglycan-associated lipoprotein